MFHMVVVNNIKLKLTIITTGVILLLSMFSVAQEPPDNERAPGEIYRRRLMQKYEAPLEDYWNDLEPLPSRGRYFGEYRIKEIEEEVEARPAYIPFEWAFRDELKKDERIISGREAFLSEHGKLAEMKREILKEKQMLREETGSPIPIAPRRKLQEYLSRRILRFWRLDEETRLEELVRYQELRERLYDLGQDETPQEFEERRMKDKSRLLSYEPLKHFKMRTVRELMDRRTQILQKKWRERSSAFSRID